MTTTLKSSVDRRELDRFLARYTPSEITKIMKIAATNGGKEGAKVMRSAAPIGTAKRLSQYYRKMGLGHGTFRKSVRAAAIRGRGTAIKGLQARTIGVVIGPMGKNAFTRAWIELGTRQARANPWVEREAAAALSVARDASESVLELYGRG